MTEELADDTQKSGVQGAVAPSAGTEILNAASAGTLNAASAETRTASDGTGSGRRLRPGRTRTSWIRPR